MSAPDSANTVPANANRSWLRRMVQRLCCKTNHHDLVIKDYNGSVGMSYATCLRCGVLQYWHDEALRRGQETPNAK